MVDPTKGIGSIQNIQPAKPQSQENGKKAERREGFAPVDEISISEEAISLSQAESSAGETRVILEDTDYALGLDPEFDTSA